MNKSFYINYSYFQYPLSYPRDIVSNNAPSIAICKATVDDSFSALPTSISTNSVDASINLKWTPILKKECKLVFFCPYL